MLWPQVISRNSREWFWFSSPEVWACSSILLSAASDAAAWLRIGSSTLKSVPDFMGSQWGEASFGGAEPIPVSILDQLEVSRKINSGKYWSKRIVMICGQLQWINLCESFTPFRVLLTKLENITLGYVFRRFSDKICDQEEFCLTFTTWESLSYDLEEREIFF